VKRIIQLIIFFFIFFFLFFFKELYFLDKKKSSKKILQTDQQTTSRENIIKNLKYEIILNKDNKYSIFSELSEIENFDGEEIIKMEKVSAIFLDKGEPLYTINSNSAEYNSYLKNTKFRNNVLIKYLDNRIYADNLDIDFINYKIKIFQNVKMISSNSVTYTDNIDINLLTNKIDIYMNNHKDKVKFNMNK